MRRITKNETSQVSKLVIILFSLFDFSSVIKRTSFFFIRYASGGQAPQGRTLCLFSSLTVSPPPTPTSDFAPRISDPSEATKTLGITCGRPDSDTVIPRMASLEVEGRDGQQADLDDVAWETRLVMQPHTEPVGSPDKCRPPKHTTHTHYAKFRNHRIS